MRFGVLGPLTAWDGPREVQLKGPRHRAVLARLLVARGRVVPVDTLVEDLQVTRGALQTFVGALRRALEPERPPRSKSSLLVTEGDGYALRAETDAERFEELLRRGEVEHLEQALGLWRGPAYADVRDSWVLGERARLGELRLVAVEAKARAEIDLGRNEVVADLDAHVAEHPWREEGWRLLALALYRSGRQKEALEVLRTARSRLVGELGLEPGPALQRLEHDILNHKGVWQDAATAYSVVAQKDSRTELRTTVELLKSLAITGGGGLVAAREQRVAAIHAAEELGDVGLTARVIGAFDVPAVWSRSDDEEQARQVVAAAERTLAALPLKAPAGQRVRLLATIAIESRGLPGPRGPEAARLALQAAKNDPALVVFALNGVFLQSFTSAGRCRERDAIGAELIEVAAEHDLEAYEILGRLVRLQALCGLGDFAQADEQAEEADRLAEAFGSPMVKLFTTWYRGMSGSLEVPAGAGMPGLTTGLAALSRLAQALRNHEPAPPGDYGPYEPWVRPLLTGTGLRETPDPPPGHFHEAMWCLVARAAVDQGDAAIARRAATALQPAAHELAAGSGLVDFGPVAGYLEEIHAKHP